MTTLATIIVYGLFGIMITNIVVVITCQAWGVISRAPQRRRERLERREVRECLRRLERREGTSRQVPMEH